MVRRHGWQLPAHTFQVVAITVFFCLAVAFYVFFAPFIGSNVLEYTAIGVYSPLALAVFILYIRSSAIDPADPGIFAHTGEKSSFNQDKKPNFSESSFVSKVDKTAIRQSPAFPLHVTSASAIHSENKACHEEIGQINISGFQESRKGTGKVSFIGIAFFICGWLIKDDGCRDEGIPEQPAADEDVLFCTLCNAEVRKFSKHCRSCDKCVDGFDHHCRWLNNCVGKKNYATFVALMAASLTLLILEGGVGVEVLIRFFMDKGGTDRQIVEKLGNSFSRAPYAAVVILCTIVSLFASIPLGELLFFHIILIRKGITTYEYVMAMRSQSEAPGVSVEGEPLSIPSSPSSSTATGLSRSSSVGLQYKGGWCTPPRIFVEHQDEVIPHLGPGRVPSTVDPDASTVLNRAGNKPSKRSVKISAWRLAKLNPDEATRAAAKARESSSILRPVGARVPNIDYSSSGNASTRSSMSTDFGQRRETRDERMPSPLKYTRAPSHASKDDGETGTQSRSSYSSTSHTNDSVSLSPLTIEHKYNLTPGFHISTTLGRVVAPPLMTSNIPTTRHSLPIYKHSVEQPLFTGMAPASEKYDAFAHENANERLSQSNLELAQPNPSQLNRNFVENKKSCVFWDQGAGRYVSMLVPLRTDHARGVGTFHAPQVVSENGSLSPRHGDLPSISSRLQSSVVQYNNLLYTEESIFYGGPLIVPAVESTKMDISPRHSEGTSQKTLTSSHVLPHQASQETRPLRELTQFAQSPVFQPRSLQTNNFPNLPSK